MSIERAFNRALDNARGIGVMSGAQIESERTAILNAVAGTCACGARFDWRAGVGAYRAACGALETRGGTVIRPCPR